MNAVAEGMFRLFGIAAVHAAEHLRKRLAVGNETDLTLQQAKVKAFGEPEKLFIDLSAEELVKVVGIMPRPSANPAK